MQILFQILTTQFNKLLPKLPEILNWIISKLSKTKNCVNPSLTSANDNFMLAQCLKKGIHSYKGKHGEKIDASWTSGFLHFKGHQIPFMSGYWGNGSAPKGEYIAKNYRVDSGLAFSLFNVGFFLEIIPQFESGRTELGIHFDGGDGSDGKEGFIGTLGCIGLKANNVDEAVRIRNIFRDAFDTPNKEIPLRII